MRIARKWHSFHSRQDCHTILIVQDWRRWRRWAGATYWTFLDRVLTPGAITTRIRCFILCKNQFSSYYPSANYRGADQLGLPTPYKIKVGNFMFGLKAKLKALSRWWCSISHVFVPSLKTVVNWGKEPIITNFSKTELIKFFSLFYHGETGEETQLMFRQSWWGGRSGSRRKCPGPKPGKVVRLTIRRENKTIYIQTDSHSQALIGLKWSIYPNICSALDAESLRKCWLGYWQWPGLLCLTVCWIIVIKLWIVNYPLDYSPGIVLQNNTCQVRYYADFTLFSKSSFLLFATSNSSKSCSSSVIIWE